MELFKLLGTIAIENEQANKALDETGEKAKKSSSETSEAFAKIGTVAGKIATGIVTAGAALGGAWLAAIEGTREYRAEMGLLDSAFVTSGHSSEAAKKTYSDLNAVLGDTGQAVEAAQHLALVADNEEELANLTHSLTGVYATFGASLPLEGLAEAINHSSSLGEVQGSLADALEWSGITVDDFNEQLAKCSDEEERQKLIMDTLNDTYGKAGEQYKKTNKDVMDAQRAQEKLTDAFAKFGEVGEPILTAIKDKVADMVSAAVPHLENFIQKVKDISQWVKENQDTIDTWVAVIIGAGTAIGTFLLILNWGAIMTAAASAINVVRTAILGMNAAMLANPIGVIVALIAGLVVAFIYLWNNVEGFRKFWLDAWAKIKSVASDAGKAIAKYFSEAWAGIKKAWGGVKPYFDLVWSNIKNIFKAVKSVLSGNFGDAWTAIKSIWNNYKKFFQGIWTGIKGVFSPVGSWFRSKFQSAWSGIKSVFSGWGSFFGGLWSKIKSKFSSIGTALGTAMGNAVKNGMNSVIAKVQSAINKGIGLINKAINLANKLPGIKVGNVPTVSLPRLARGGVLEKGQVGLLEGSGAEAVVPLEHNRKWLSKVAEDLKVMLYGGMPNEDNTQVIMMLEQIATLLREIKKLKIWLDTGAMVGELVPVIDGRMADRYSHYQRGNTR